MGLTRLGRRKINFSHSDHLQNWSTLIPFDRSFKINQKNLEHFFLLNYTSRKFDLVQTFKFKMYTKF